MVAFFAEVALRAGALSLAELGTMIHKSGGDFIYILTAFAGDPPARGGIKPVPAFLHAWTTVLLLKPAGLGIMALSFAKYIVQPAFLDCDSPSVPTKLLAAGCICEHRPRTAKRRARLV